MTSEELEADELTTKEDKPAKTRKTSGTHKSSTHKVDIAITMPLCNFYDNGCIRRNS